MVSVVMRCRNEERYIGYALQSIHDFFGYDVEIIIIDNESTDNSIRVVNTFEYLDIKNISISKNEYSPGKALNMGINKCKNDYILVLSSHCQITKLDFEEVKKQLDSGKAAVWGKQIPIWDGKRVTPRYIWSNFGDKLEFNYYCESEKRYFLHNAFSIYWKHDLEKFPFDERLSGKEDRYWANDRIKEGYRVLYNPELVCKHNYTTGGATWKGVG